MCSYSVVFLSLTIILLDIHPMKLPQSWWWELKLRREGFIIESKKERGRQIKAAGQSP
jgi:hypothetical protein